MTNNEKGTHAELLFCAEVTSRGLQVLIPIGPTGSTVDVWIVVNSRPVSVQVKRAWITKGGRYSVRAARRGTKKIPEKVYKAGDFDILAAYLPDRNQFVLWRFDEIKQRKKISYTPRLHRQPDNWDLLDTVLK
jgi:hypothetical protein